MNHPPSQSIVTSHSYPIGVFDSGVGGLTVLDALYQGLPHENYVYYGDTLHMPYGSKSPQMITQLVDSILAWLTEQQQVKLIAVACNTSAGVLYETLATRSPVPIVEPITPVCQWIASQTTFKKIGLLATPTTVQSQRYQRVLQDLQPNLQVKSVACEGLAKLIEEGQRESPACQALLERLLLPLQQWEPDALILGCTHYPHAADQIQPYFPSIPLLDPAQFMVQKIQQVLEGAQQLNTQSANGNVSYHVSLNPSQFLNSSAQLPLRHLPVTLPQLTLLNPLLETV